jgi:hypothetical protein
LKTADKKVLISEVLIIEILRDAYKNLEAKDMIRHWVIITTAALLLGTSCAIFTPTPQVPVEPPVAEPQNHPPIIKTMVAQSKVSALSTIQLVCEAEDPDGDELTYSWSADGGTIEGQGAVVNWTAPETPGEYTIAVLVNDGHGGTATQSVTISVTDKPNQPPIITSLVVNIARPVGPIEIDPSIKQLDRPIISVRTLTPVAITCIAEDPDDNELTYTWTATDGKITDEEGRKIVWIAPTNPIRHFVTVEVNDGRGGSSTAKVAFDVSCCK